MAGDWIKMRSDLYRHPKVCLIADIIGSPASALGQYVNQNCQRDITVTRNVMRNASVGALVAVWGVLRHRGERIDDDLHIKKATIDVIDQIAELPGFGDAMCEVGWLYETPQGLVMPRFFSEHNVEPNSELKEKNRERQRRFRERQRNELHNVTVTSQSNARERVRVRDNKPPISPPSQSSDDAFDRFWKTYPRKVGKRAAKAAWNKAVEAVRKETLCSAADATALIERAAGVFSESDTAKSEFCPHPATWLNQGRYDDDQAAWKRNGHQEPVRCQMPTDEELANWNPINGGME